jgi:tight adherence protein C
VIRALGACGLLAAVGWTLLLSGVPWFRRKPLVVRVGPYLPGAAKAQAVSRPAGASLSELVEPLARVVGKRVARVFGVTESLAVRLARVHAPIGVAEFRVQQLGWAAVGFGGAIMLVVVTGLPGLVALGFLLGGPLLAFLVVEQRLALRSEQHKRRVFAELPVVAEQLAMLLGAGYSLGSALHRLAERGRGACGADLARVCERIGVGVGENEALQEWAAIADVPAVNRLVSVLGLNRHAGDLDRLIREEAQSIRRDVHRDLVATIERRAQQVWVPVTVATLVPGTIFLAVPFVDALRLFSQA